MPTDSPKPDRSRWFVPIVVATIAALATILAAVLPLVLQRGDGAATPDPAAGSQPPTTTGPRSRTPTPAATTAAGDPVDHKGSQVLIGFIRTADLDRGGATVADDIPDIEMAGTALVATAHSRLALLSGPRYSVDICRQELAERGGDRVPASDIRIGSVLCIQTSAGRLGVVILDTVTIRNGDLHQVNFNYTVWSATP